jgi:hypothetical protein
MTTMSVNCRVSNVLKTKIYLGKVKAKFSPRTRHEDPEGTYRYSSTLSLTSALDFIPHRQHILL